MKITGAATVFQVGDLEAALHYYQKVLSFHEDFHFDTYAGVHLGECCLHLCAHNFWKRPRGGAAASIFTDEVDQYCKQVRSRGAKIEATPDDRDYGMRDFVVSDPDGNLLTFGCPLPQPKAPGEPEASAS